MTIRTTLMLLAIVATIPACAATYGEQKRLFAAPPEAAAGLEPATMPQTERPAAPSLETAKITVAADTTIPFIDQAGLDRNNELNRLSALILRHNPAIKSTRATVAARIETYGQEQAINDLLSTYQSFTAGLAPGVGPVKMATTDLALPQSASLRSRLAALEVEQARIAREKTIARAITRGRKLYFRLIHNQTAQGLTGKSLKLFRDLEKVAMTRYSSGKTPYGQVIAIRIKKQKLTTRLRDLEEEEKTLRRDLFELCAAPIDHFTFIPPATTPTPPDPKAMIAAAEQTNLDLRLAKNRRLTLATMYDLGRFMAVPDFSAGLSRRMGGEISGRFTDKKMTATGRITDGFKGANLFYLERLRLAVNAADEKVKAAKHRARGTARDAWDTADRHRRRIKLLKEHVVPLSRAALAVARRGLEAGSISFTALTRADDAWLNNRLALSTAQMQLGTATAELSLAVGRNLEDMQ